MEKPKDIGLEDLKSSIGVLVLAANMKLNKYGIQEKSGAHEKFEGIPWRTRVFLSHASKNIWIELSKVEGFSGDGGLFVRGYYRGEKGLVKMQEVQYPSELDGITDNSVRSLVVLFPNEVRALANNIVESEVIPKDNFDLIKIAYNEQTNY